MATRGSEPVTVASLEVTPKEAEALAVAAQASTLHLVLHGSWTPGQPLPDSALGASASACPMTGTAPLLARTCPTRNPPPEFVAPRR